MHDHNDNDGYADGGTMRASLIMLAFGLCVLAFLIAIERPHWFHIRPISGTAAAMQAASSPSLATGRD